MQYSACFSNMKRAAKPVGKPVSSVSADILSVSFCNVSALFSAVLIFRKQLTECVKYGWFDYIF